MNRITTLSLALLTTAALTLATGCQRRDDNMPPTGAGPGGTSTTPGGGTTTPGSTSGDSGSMTGTSPAVPPASSASR
jgi:hypothetical protein